MKNSEINNVNQSLEKFIYKSTLFFVSYLQSTTFLHKNIIYNLHVLTPSDLQSTIKIMAKSTIYNLTSPPPNEMFEDDDKSFLVKANQAAEMFSIKN